MWSFPRGLKNLNKPLAVFDVWYFLSLSFGGTLQQVLTFLLFTQPSPGTPLTGTLQIYAGTFSQGGQSSLKETIFIIMRSPMQGSPHVRKHAFPNSYLEKPKPTGKHDFNTGLWVVWGWGPQFHICTIGPVRGKQVRPGCS